MEKTFLKESLFYFFTKLLKIKRDEIFIFAICYFLSCNDDC